MTRTLLIILVIYYLFINIVTFVAMFMDKRKAIKGAYRISEKTLFTLSLFGGFIGNYLAMQKFRHKTQHKSFYIVNIVSFIIHILLLFYVFI